jgi:prevent-host-death family protein
MQVSVLEARNRLSQLIKAAQAGEEVVIANRGTPVVQLVPANPPIEARPSRGNAKAILEWLEHHKLPHYARRSAAEIDAAIEAERRAWD